MYFQVASTMEDMITKQYPNADVHTIFVKDKSHNHEIV